MRRNPHDSHKQAHRAGSFHKNALRLAVSKDWISQPSKRPPMRMLPLGTSKPHRLLSVRTFPSAIRGGILLLSSAMHIITEAKEFESSSKDTTINYPRSKDRWGCIYPVVRLRLLRFSDVTSVVMQHRVIDNTLCVRDMLLHNCIRH